MPVGKQEDIIEISIIQRIHEIRGVKVILNFGLAERYGVETRVLKQAVRRNIKRFEGDDFMFELTKDEIFTLSRSQFVTLKKGRGNNIKYLPFAFTELGVAMLSSVLSSDIAIDINRKIMRTFVAIRQYAFNYADLNQKIEKLTERLDNTDAKTSDIFELLKKLLEHKKELEKPSNPIGFRTGANS